MLAEAAAWWKEQMRDLVPASIRPLGQDWRRVLLVMTETANATEVELCLQGRGGRTSLGRYAIEGGLQHALGRVSRPCEAPLCCRFQLNGCWRGRQSCHSRPNWTSTGY
jgi:hypothetical protein